jgi:hypothetical protein
MKKILGYNWFHTHPNLERKLGVGNEHVIVDKDEYLAVLYYIHHCGITPESIIKLNTFLPTEQTKESK